MAYSAIGKWKEAKEDGLACIERDKTFLKGYHRAANAMINPCMSRSLLLMFRESL